MADRPGPLLIDRTTAQTIDAAVGYLINNGASEAAMVLRSLLVPFWAPGENVGTNAVRMTAAGVTIKRISAGVTRSSYDATEAALWTITGGTGGGGSSSASDLTSGTLPPARLGDGSIALAKLAFDVATQAELDAVSGATTDASRLTSGTLAPARIGDGTLPTTKLGGTLSDAQIPASITRDSELAAALAALVAAAPGTLDTLDELAAALGDDPNFATTVTALIGTKVGKTGAETIAGVKTFSSPPSVPAPVGASDATTKGYVDTAVAGVVAGTSTNRDFNGTSWPARGSGSDIIHFWSTKHPNAPQPSDMALGDTWVRHPDAV